MKKKKIVITTSLIVVLSLLAILIFTPKRLSEFEKRVKLLDSNYENLSDLNLITPFDLTKLDDYKVHELSTDHHVGIDFFAKSGVEQIPFIAMQTGIVEMVDLHIMYDQNGTDNWAVGIIIALNSRFKFVLNFETFSPSNEIRDLQMENIFVKEGDLISQGDVIGNLITQAESAHVHFSIADNTIAKDPYFTKPEPYFKPDCLNTITQVLENS